MRRGIHSRGTGRDIVGEIHPNARPAGKPSRRRPVKDPSGPKRERCLGIGSGQELTIHNAREDAIAASDRGEQRQADKQQSDLLISFLEQWKQSLHWVHDAAAHDKFPSAEKGIGRFAQLRIRDFTHDDLACFFKDYRLHSILLFRPGLREHSTVVAIHLALALCELIAIRLPGDAELGKKCQPFDALWAACRELIILRLQLAPHRRHCRVALLGIPSKLTCHVTRRPKKKWHSACNESSRGRQYENRTQHNCTCRSVHGRNGDLGIEDALLNWAGISRQGLETTSDATQIDHAVDFQSPRLYMLAHDDQDLQG